MWKIVKVDNKVIVLFDDGTLLESKVSEEEYNKVCSALSKEEITAILKPSLKEKIEEYNVAKSILEKVHDSKLLYVENDTIYWKEVSPFSLPIMFVDRILMAEEANNKLLIDTYRNFWTLMSINPSKECRENLFWFLQRYGMTISKSGFFVAYRNVDTTDEKNVFTDHHSHTFKIKIGEMVTMKREECDSDNTVTCSRGLHVAGKGWLKRNYYGNLGLACLVNPADVVAVPKEDSYGKLRTCAYLPMEVIHYDENDDIIPLNIEDGFDCSYITKVIYEGIMGTEKDSTYKIEIPTLENDSIQDKLLQIAQDCIVNKQL